MAKFLNTNETIVLKYRLDGNVIAEALDQTKIKQISDVWRDDDRFHSAYRLDLDTMTMEDVTEQVADAWLSLECPQEGEYLPPFVIGTDALEIYQDAMSRAGRLERRVYNAMAVQS